MRKVAFLVANDTFPEDPSIPSLLFPQNDAQKLAEVLKDQETCGFEAIPYLNKTSLEILSDLDEISRELTQDDTLLFYYSGHGKLSGNELCLVSMETRTARLRSTSIKASEVLGYLQESSARRRILVLDCCHSGAIANIYRGGDAESALSGLAHSYGTCILTASTAIQLAEEREKDGHGVFTKALIDCLCEPLKERITVDDWYDFAFNRLKISGNQTPRIRNSREGDAIEIGNFKKKLDRLAEQEREQLISKARDKLNNLVSAEVLHEKEVEWWVHLLELGENLSLRNRQSRDDLIRYLKGEIDPWRVFGRVREIDGRPPPPEPAPLFAVAPIPSEPPVLDPPVTPSAAPEVLPATGGGGALREAKKPIWPPKALLTLAGFVIGAVILAVYFFLASGTTKTVRLEDNEKQASLAATHEESSKSPTASPAENAPSPVINAPVPSGGAQTKAPSLSVKALGTKFSSLNDLQNTLYLDTKDGRVTILLRPDLAPKHVAQIEALTKRGFYNGLVFHRVIDGFMAQTGDPTGTGTGKSDLPNIPAEFSAEPFRRGTVGMARSQDPDSANSQFFISLADAAFLNNKYTVIGQVISGMDAVDKIKKGAKDDNGAVTGPDKIVKMQLAADAASGKK